MPTTQYIVRYWLVSRGFDGLANEALECGCLSGDLDPRACLQGNCRAMHFSGEVPERTQCFDRGSEESFVVKLQRSEKGNPMSDERCGTRGISQAVYELQKSVSELEECAIELQERLGEALSPEIPSVSSDEEDVCVCGSLLYVNLRSLNSRVGRLQEHLQDILDRLEL